MSDFDNGGLNQLINKCKSELLNHALQEQVASEHIRNINTHLDSCLDILHNKNLIQRPNTSSPRISGNNESSIPRFNTRSPRIRGNNKDNALFFAYCLSKYDYPFLVAVTEQSFNQSEAFSYLEAKLGIKANTIKNYRDTFDPHLKQVRSDRQGWWQKDITQTYKDVIRKYDSLSEAQLIKQAKAILQGDR